MHRVLALLLSFLVTIAGLTLLYYSYVKPDLVSGLTNYILGGIILFMGIVHIGYIASNWSTLRYRDQ